MKMPRSTMAGWLAADMQWWVWGGLSSNFTKASLEFHTQPILLRGFEHFMEPCCALISVKMGPVDSRPCWTVLGNWYKYGWTVSSVKCRGSHGKCAQEASCHHCHTSCYHTNSEGSIAMSLLYGGEGADSTTLSHALPFAAWQPSVFGSLVWMSSLVTQCS